MSSKLSVNTSATQATSLSGVYVCEYLRICVRTNLGPVSEVIADSLMGRGPQTLKQLVQSTQIDIDQVRRGLMSMIQHDVVTSAIQVPKVRAGEKPKKIVPRVIYSLDAYSVRSRTRFASYLLHLKHVIGPEAETVLQILAMHGKLSSSQLLDSCCAHIQQLQAAKASSSTSSSSSSSSSSTSSSSSSSPAPVDRSIIHNTFKQLVALGYIKRAAGIQGMENPTSAPKKSKPDADDEEDQYNDAGDKVRKYPVGSELTEKIHAAAAAAAAAVANADAISQANAAVAAARKRKSKADEAEEENATKKKRKTKKELLKEQEEEQARAKLLAEEQEAKRKLDEAVLESSSESEDPGLLWVINHDCFLDIFRKGAVLEYVLEKYGKVAFFLAEAMITQYPNANDRRAPVLDIDSILDLVEDRKTDRESDKYRNATIQALIAGPVPNISKTTAQEYLDQMSQDQSGFFERMATGYIMNFPLLFNDQKLRNVQSTCREKHGPLGGRIFNLLQVHKRLEETTVAEYAVAPRKEVRKTLFELYHDSFITMQEVPRSSDRMPARTFFLWGVNTKEVTKLYSEKLFMAWVRTRLRLEKETEDIKPVLDKIDTQKAITEDEKRAVERWKKGADRMEAALSKLNQLIMLFEDF